MAEVSPPRALNPADRTVPRPSADNPTKTGASLPFRHHLHRPPAGINPAHGPALLPHRLGDAQTSAEAPPPAPQAAARRGSETAPEPEAGVASEAVLDPFFCQLAVNPGLTSSVQHNSPACVAPAALPLREDLQNLLTGLSRRAAWGGDRRKGSARIELSEGALAGATLIVHAEQRSVSVELELPPGVAALGWQRRIAERLEGRGFAARVKVG